MSLLKKSLDLSEVPEDQRTFLVDNLLEIILFRKEHTLLQNEVILGLKDKIVSLKGEKSKPMIKTSNLGKKTNARREQWSSPGY